MGEELGNLAASSASPPLSSCFGNFPAPVRSVAVRFSLILLALKLFHGKTCFFLSARGGMIPVFSSGWDQEWDKGVSSSTAQQSTDTCQLHTPSGCQESWALMPGFDLLQNIVSSEKKKKRDRESSQRAKLLRTRFEPAPCRSNSRRNSGQAVFSYGKGPRESEGAKLN